MHQFFEHLQPLMFDHKQFNENINIMLIDDSASNHETIGLRKQFSKSTQSQISKRPKISVDLDQTPFNSQKTPTR